MAHEEIPLSPEQVPKEARQYLAAIQQYPDHSIVRDNFFQVTILTMIVPNQGQTTFYVLEFRAGQNAALIWQDGQGNWGAGSWVRLAHVEADITCPPSGISLAYFQGAQANASFGGALDILAKSKRPAAPYDTARRFGLPG